MSFCLNTISHAAKLSQSFYQDNEKRKIDPFKPALRSKGEKARNRHSRFVSAAKCK